MINLSSHLGVRLGPDGPEIAPLGIGTWQWGDRFYWGYGRGGYTDEDIQAAFDAALAAGVTFFDTAEVYGMGRSERILGRLVGKAGASVVTASKFFPFPWRFTRRSLPRALRHSLKRLGLAHLDLYQMHWPFPPVSIETWMQAMADAVEDGKIGAVGVSNYNAAQTRRAHAALAARGIPLTSNQIKYSLLEREPERNGLLETCRELGVTVIAYSPLAQGLLTGKYSPKNPPSGLRGRSAERLAAHQPLIELMRQIGETHDGKTPSQVALNWLIGKGMVPIPGVKNLRQAQDNLEALSWSLSEEEVAQLDASSAEVAQ
jgi:aryl-alcohol dehydrogenase-like predicted oxidoreductase